MSKQCILNENSRLVRVTTAKTLHAVIELLLNDWVNGDEDLDGVCGFMRTQVDEGTGVSGFATSIHEWLTDEQQVGFLTAVEPTIRVRSREHPDVAAALADGYDLIEDEGEDEDEDPVGND